MILFYLSSRGVVFEDIKKIMNDLNYSYLFPIFGFQLLIPFLRGYRLQFLYSSIHKLDFFTVFKINSVGYLFIFLLPMRIGEFIIPYLIKKNTPLSLSSAMAVIVVERLTDLLVLVILLLIILTKFLLPEWLVQSVFTLGIFLFLFLMVLVLIYFKSEVIFPVILRIFSFLPKAIYQKIEYVFNEFSIGLKIIHSPFQILKLLFISILIWANSSIVIYLIFQMMNIKLGFEHGLVVMSINTVGVALPAGPGVIGNFQYSCILALELFKIDKTIAFAFSNIYYLIGVGLTLGIGFTAFPFINLSFSELKKDILYFMKR